MRFLKKSRKPTIVFQSFLSVFFHLRGEWFSNIMRAVFGRVNETRG